MHNLGHPPRRWSFSIWTAAWTRLPKHGTPVILDDGGRSALSGAPPGHYELGPIALAVVKRTVPVDATLTAGEVAATQEVIVPPDAGRNASRSTPRCRRR